MSGFLGFDAWGGFEMDTPPVTPSTTITLAPVPSRDNRKENPRGIGEGPGAISSGLASILGYTDVTLSEHNAGTIYPWSISRYLSNAPVWVPYLGVLVAVGGVDYFIRHNIKEALLVGGASAGSAYWLNIFNIPRV